MFFSNKKSKSAPRRTRQLRMGEGLEGKSMMAADAVLSYNAVTNTIHIEGSDYADKIEIEVDAKGTANRLDDLVKVKVSYDSNGILPFGNETRTLNQPLYTVKVEGLPPVLKTELAVTRIVVNGGDGNDVVTNDTNINMVATGGDGNDEFFGGSGADVVSGSNGNDVLYGRGGADSLFGNDGNDFLFGNEGNDILQGGDHNDRLFGHEGNDLLYGNDGEDVLNGGIGEDRLNGGDDGDVDRLTGGPGVYTDAFHTESHLVAGPGLTLKLANREEFVDFNKFNDIDEPDSLGTGADATHTLPHQIGDINANGVSDINDFVIFKNNFGKAGERNDGDLTGDGKVDILDFVILKNQFGKSADYDFAPQIFIPVDPGIFDNVLADELIERL